MGIAVGVLPGLSGFANRDGGLTLPSAVTALGWFSVFSFSSPPHVFAHADEEMQKRIAEKISPRRRR